MLVLTRLPGEHVYIDVPASPCGCCAARRIVVSISDVQGKKVRIGFEAQDDVRFLRTELLQGRQPEAKP